MGKRSRRVALVATTLLVLGGIGAACAPQPSSGSPRDPVILVHGFTGCSGLEVSMEPLANRLRSAGYRTHLFGYPDCGFGDIRDNAARLDVRIDQILASTGATQVDVVGWSMGGLVARYSAKHLGGADKMDSIITLGTPHYGTALANVANFFFLGNCVGVVACQQMSTGSAFLEELNAGPDAVDGVHLTAITTALDQVVVPFQNGQVRDGVAGNFTNAHLQSHCPLRVVGHIGLIADGSVADGVLDALAKRPVSFNCFAI